MNICSLPKHGGELVNFSSMEAKFGVIILTEICARNVSVKSISELYFPLCAAT